MKLNSLELENFRCFKSIKIDFDEHLTVLVAENGAGKTAILDGIAVALGAFVGSFNTGVNKGFKAQDARLIIKSHIAEIRSLVMMESQYPIIMNAKGIIDNKVEIWHRKLTGAKNKTTTADAKALSSYGKDLQKIIASDSDIKPDLPIIAYYGTGRLWRQIKIIEKSNRESRSRLFGYHDALEPASNYKEFEKWFRDASIASYSAIIAKLQANQTIDTFDLNNRETAVLKSVRDAINSSLKSTDWQDIFYDAKSQELIIKHSQNGYIAVSQLSDGVKNMLAMTADIAYRCAKLNPHLISPHKETKGIVLIDEIDMHLHPKWQQTVLQDLQNAFPKIQFIVTTHSPQVLSTVKRESIRLIGKNTNGEDIASIPMAHSYGEISSNVLESIMHVNPQPPIIERNDLEQLTEWVDQGQYNTPDAISKFKQLKSILGEKHPQLQRLERSIKRQEILNS